MTCQADGHKHNVTGNVRVTLMRVRATNIVQWKSNTFNIF